MLAKRKSNGKIIEVEESCAYDGELGYWDSKNNDFYYPSDLDFLPEKETAVIEGWVCRDKKDNALNLHAEEPYRTQSGYQKGDEPDWWESDCASFLPLDNNLFPDLTWDSEPEQVEIIIKRKKNAI